MARITAWWKFGKRQHKHENGGSNYNKGIWDRSLVFSKFLHEVKAPQGYKSDRARFLNKYPGGSQMGEKNHFGGVFDVFFPHLCI